jgi:hypothetical protein
MNSRVTHYRAKYEDVVSVSITSVNRTKFWCLLKDVSTQMGRLQTKYILATLKRQYALFSVNTDIAIYSFITSLY